MILSKFPLTRRSGGIGEDPLPRHLAADLTIGGRGITLVAIHPTNPLRISRCFLTDFFNLTHRFVDFSTSNRNLAHRRRHSHNLRR